MSRRLASVKMVAFPNRGLDPEEFPLEDDERILGAEEDNGWLYVLVVKERTV